MVMNGFKGFETKELRAFKAQKLSRQTR